MLKCGNLKSAAPESVRDKLHAGFLVATTTTKKEASISLIRIFKRSKFDANSEEFGSEQKDRIPDRCLGVVRANDRNINYSCTV